MEQPSATYWDDAGHPGHSPGPGPGLLARHHQHHDSSRLTSQTPLLHVPLGPSSEAGSRLQEDQSIFHYCEGNLNFSTANSEDDDYFHKRKLSRDPMSHRIIEKRRRDRMNNCLADLSRLIPAEYLKKGRGRVEKTEIIEMAIKHMQYLQSKANLAAGIDCATPPHLPGDLRVTKCEQSPGSDREVTPLSEAPATPPPHGLGHGADPTGAIRPVVRPIVTEHYRLGYQECLSEAMHFLVEVEGYFAGDSLCVKLISHLQKHCDKIVKGDRLNFPRTRQPGETTSSSGSSSSYGAAGGSVSASKQGASQSQSSSTEESPSPAGLTATQCAQQASNPRGRPSNQLRDILCGSPPSPTPSQPPYHGDAMGHHGHHGLHGLPQHFETCTERCAERCGGGDADGPDGLPHHDAHSPHHPYADTQHHHSYKFKNNIKQRFCEEHSNVGGLKRRRTATRSPPPSPSATPTPSASQPSQHAASSQTQASVPIFVLHTKGSFYIPLTVSYEALAPYLDVDLLSDAGSTHTASGPMALGLVSSATPSGMVLHPVTISVNFQQYWKPPTQTPHAHPHTAVAALPAAAAPALPPHSSHLLPSPNHPSSGHGWSRHGQGASDAGAFYPPSPWEMCAGRT